jgi:signal transduction histidine kinase
MTDETTDRARKLRHDIANPLAALLAEVQLLLLSAERLDAETLSSLKEVERLALRMRDILKNA